MHWCVTFSHSISGLNSVLFFILGGLEVRFYCTLFSTVTDSLEILSGASKYMHTMGIHRVKSRPMKCI